MKLFNAEQHEASIERTIQRLSVAANAFADQEARFPSEVGRLGGVVKELRAAYADLAATRRLRVGIVGQVKAGKSTLLNTLLFGGDEVLAKAATPMTAALTYLRHGPSPRVTVEYFSREEWDDVEAAARGDAKTSSQARAAQEQLQMLREQGLDIGAYLGKSQTIEAEAVQDLAGRMRAYIGVDGKFTPLVKCMTLEVPNDQLLELEFIDTPGLNDPVHARSQRTRRDMAKCDVVFVMSYMGKFLDAEDMQLMSQHLPNNAVARCVLVGTKFDSALMDVKFDYETAEAAIADVQRQLRGQAESVMARYMQALPTDGAAYQMLTGLREPLFVSAMGEMIHDRQGHWTEEQADLHQKLVAMWPDGPLDLASLKAIGNMGAIRAAMREVAAGAEATIVQRLGGLAKAHEAKAAAILDELCGHASKVLKTLEHTSAEQLGRQQSQLSTVGKASTRVEVILGDLLDATHAQRLAVIEGLYGVKEQYAKVQTQTGTRDESYTVTESRSRQKRVLFGLIPWGSEDYEVEVEKSRTITYQYAAVDDAIGAVDAFASAAILKIERSINGLVDRKALKQKLKAAILDTLDPGDENFDAEMIGLAIEQVATRMVLPQLSLVGADYLQMVSGSFSGNVMGGDIANLRARVKEAIAKVVDDLDFRFKDEMTRFDTALAGSMATFLDQVLESVHDELEQLQSGLARGHAEVEAYRALITKVERVRQDIQGVPA